MQIDWTTLVLEVVNFLALVWILKRFLYKPVMETLAARQARVEGKLADARAIEDGAKDLQLQYERRLADWDTEKAKARALLDNEVSQERNRQMQALKKALADEQERVAAVAAHRQDDLQRELELEALAHAQRFTAALLSRLANSDIEARFVALLLEDFAKLPETQLEGLRRSVTSNNAEAVVTTAFPLPEAQREQIKKALARGLQSEIRVTFGEDSSLISGVRLSLGPWQLNLNFADELAGFKASANHVL